MHGGHDAFALYERCTNAVPTDADRVVALADPLLAVVLKRIADEIGYGFR